MVEGAGVALVELLEAPVAGLGALAAGVRLLGEPFDCTVRRGFFIALVAPSFAEV